MSSSVTRTEMIQLNMVHIKDWLWVVGQNPAVLGEAGEVFLVALCGPSSAAELLEFLPQHHIWGMVLKNSCRTFKSSVEVK